MKTKQMLSIFLSFIILFSLLSQGVIAFAEDMLVPVVIEADKEKKEKKLGDIDIDDYDDLLTALLLSSTNGGSASATVNGNIDLFAAAGAWGVETVTGDQKSTSTAVIDGSISAISDFGLAYGIYTEGQGTNNINVGGDVFASSNDGTAFGALASMYSEGKAQIDIGGGVTAIAPNGMATGLRANIREDNNVSFDVAENVDVSAAEDAIGLSVLSYFPGDGNAEMVVNGDVTVTSTGNAEDGFRGYGVSSSSAGIKSNVSIDGNVTVNAANATGVGSSVMMDGKSTVKVAKDVTVNSTADESSEYAGTSNVTAVNTSAQIGGETNISVGGDVAANGGYGSATAIRSSNMSFSYTDESGKEEKYFGESSVSVDGLISAESFGEYTSAIGVSVSNYGGDSTINAAKGLTSSSMNGNATGASLSNYGDGTVQFNAADLVEVYAGDGRAAGITTNTYIGKTDVKLEEDLEVSSENGFAKGLSSYNQGGSNTYSLKNVTVEGSNGAIGVQLSQYENTDMLTTDQTKKSQEENVETNLVVDGDVTVKTENWDGTGISVHDVSGGTTNLTISGEVSTTSENGYAKAIDAEASNGSEVNIVVMKDVKQASNGTEWFPEPAILATSEGKDSTLTVIIGGDLNSDVSGNRFLFSDANALSLRAANNSVTDVTVDGDVISSNSGVKISSGTSDFESKGKVVFSAGGDISAEENGLVVDGKGTKWINNENGMEELTYGNAIDVDVLVEGTISGAQNAVLIDNLSAKNVSLTVWKIDMTGRDNAISYSVQASEKETVKAAENAASIEENILYIVKVEKPEEGATVSLEGTTESHGFETAREGETVSLKTSLDQGFRLVGAYNGTDERTKAALLQDDNGDYYIVVPKGGGVYLTIDAERIFNIENFGSPVLPGMTAGVQNNQASPVYLPGAGASDGSVVLSSSPSQDYGLAQVTLYRNGSYVIYKTDGSAESGTYAYGDGQLKFDGKLVEHWIDAEGNIHCVYVNARGERIEFVIDKATASSLAA